MALIEMNQKELTKTFMMISNGKKHFGLYDVTKKISTSRVNACIMKEQAQGHSCNNCFLFLIK